jgi:hypothetical protein
MTETEAKRSIEETEPTAVLENADKKQKTSPCDMAALKKQVEYYLSDSNLKHDKFFHSKITENAEGWLSLEHILACNKIKVLTASSADIVSAVSTSSELETNEAGDAIRRKNPLPSFEGELRRPAKAGKDKNPAVYKRQITLGDFKFPNLTAAKKRVGEILKSRKAGLLFKEGTPDYNLVAAVMKEHPNATSKMEGMVGIKVDVSPMGESRCFFIVKGENKDQFEDISIVKAFNNLENKLISEADSPKPQNPIEQEKGSEEVKPESETVSEEVSA